MIGVIEKIDGRNFTINGDTKEVKGGIPKAIVGDSVDYKIDKKSKKFMISKVVEEVIVTPQVEEGKKIEEENFLEVKKVKTTLKKITIDEHVSVKRLKKYGNELIEDYIRGGKFDFSDLTHSQFGTLENKLVSHNYSFNSIEINEFVEKRIERKKSPKFYISFKDNFVGRLDEFQRDSRLEVIDKEVINRELFLLLKKYYRYEEALGVITEKGVGRNEF